MRRMYFGTTATGVPVHLFLLESDTGVSVSVMEFGATIVSIETPDRDGRSGPVVWGFDRLEPYLEPNRDQSATQGRYAGRVRNRFSEPANSKSAHSGGGAPHKLHRNASGLHSTVWWGEALGEGVRFHYCSPDGEDGYPGKLDCSVEYRLDQTGCLRVIHRATTDAPTVVDLTNPVYFNLRDGGSGSVLDHELWLDAEEIVELDRDGVPTGHFLPIAGSALDFRSPRRVGEENAQRVNEPPVRARGDYNDCYVLPRATRDEPAIARLRDPSTGRNLELATSQPGIRFETRATAAADADPRQPEPSLRRSVCLCPQNFPNAANHRHFPSPELAPGSFYSQTTAYRFWNER